MADESPQIFRGLRGVYADTTTSSFIDGDVGKLLYRGYNIHDLAEKSTFEEIVYLLLYGALPTKSQLEEIDATLRASRGLPSEVLQVLEVVKESHPMDALRTGVSVLGCFDPERDDNSVEATRRKGIRITAQVPTLVTAHHRIRQGLDPVEPDPELNHAGNFLYMLEGERPQEEEMKLMDVDFIVHAEHGSNASSFAAQDGRFYGFRPPFCHRGRHRGSERAVARRSRRGRHEDGPGHRSAGERRGLRPQHHR